MRLKDLYLAVSLATRLHFRCCVSAGFLTRKGDPSSSLFQACMFCPADWRFDHLSTEDLQCHMISSFGISSEGGPTNQIDRFTHSISPSTMNTNICSPNFAGYGTIVRSSVSTNNNESLKDSIVSWHFDLTFGMFGTIMRIQNEWLNLG